MDSCSACEPGAIEVGRVFGEQYPYSLVAANADGQVIRASAGELQWLDDALAPTRASALENARGEPLEPWNVGIGPDGDVVVLAGLRKDPAPLYRAGSLIAFRADGKERWRTPVTVAGPSNIAVGAHRVFLGSGDSSVVLLQVGDVEIKSKYVASLDLHDGSVVWTSSFPRLLPATDFNNVLVAALPGDEVAIAGVIAPGEELVLGGTAPPVVLADVPRAFVAAIDAGGRGRWAIPILSPRSSEITALASSPDGMIAATILHDFMLGGSQPQGWFGGLEYTGSSLATLIHPRGEARWIHPTIEAHSVATDGSDIVAAGIRPYHVEEPFLARIGTNGERWREKAPYSMAIAGVTPDHIVAAFPVYDGLVFGETTLHDDGLLVARLVP